MHVAVCIVSYRSVEDVRGCLEALAKSTATDFEVVICENAGAAAYAELQRALPAVLPHGQKVRAVEAPGNLGYAGGVNLCMRESAAADAWWVLNPDTAPAEGALEALIRRLGAGDCEAAGGTLVLPDGRVQAYGGRWRRFLARAESIGIYSPVEHRMDQAEVEALQNYLSGASMLVGRTFYERVGPMREDYFLYCEEVEWCLRAQSLGLKLGFAEDCFVLHRQGTSTGSALDVKRQSKLSVYLNERNRLLLTRDRYPALFGVASVSALLLIAARFARRGAWRQFGYALEGWLAGLRGERGPPAGMVAL